MHEVQSLPELNDWLSEDGKILVDIWASWCQPCKRMEPILKDIDAEYSAVTILTVEADTQVDIMKHFDVVSVPTYIYFENGVEKARVIGAKPKLILEKQLGMF